MTPMNARSVHVARQRSDEVTVPSPPTSAVAGYDPASTQLTHADYVAAFLAWCAMNGLEGWTAWKKIVALSFEFADYSGIKPMSEMALAKAVKATALPRRVRDIGLHEREYTLTIEAGCVRPRELLIELPVSTTGQISDSAVGH